MNQDDGTDVVYSPEQALLNVCDRVAQLEHDNAILRAAVTYYRGALAETQDAHLNGMTQAMSHQ